MLTDQIGNEVYASHYAERKAYRFIIGCGTVLLLGSMGLNLLSGPPPALRIAISASMRWAAPRRSSTATSTTARARARCAPTSRIGPTTATPSAATPSPRSTRSTTTSCRRHLASQLMTEDNQNHLVSQVMGGQIEQSDVEVKNVTITSMSQETVQGAVMARGTALVASTSSTRPALARAKNRALDAQSDLLPESQTGERPGQDLSAISSSSIRSA